MEESRGHGGEQRSRRRAEVTEEIRGHGGTGRGAEVIGLTNRPTNPLCSYSIVYIHMTFMFRTFFLCRIFYHHFYMTENNVHMKV